MAAQQQRSRGKSEPKISRLLSLLTEIILLLTAPGISSIITPDALQRLLGELTEEEKTAIRQHLPDNQQTDEGLRQNLLSPQLR